MGANLSSIRVVFDTGSTWLVVETQECAACTTTYNYTPNLGVSYTTIANSSGVRSYGDGTTLNGHQAYDYACLSSQTSSCAKNFVWFAVSSATKGLNSNEDGILGLGSGQSSSSGPLIVNYLRDQLVIDDSIFGLALRGTSDDSTIDFGVVDKSAFTSQSEIAWLPVLNKSSFWMNKVTGIRFRHQIDS